MGKKFFTILILAFILLLALWLMKRRQQQDLPASVGAKAVKALAVQRPWTAPDSSTLPGADQGRLIRYGRDLISSTAAYFGPAGSISKKANGMNCQNCHLQGGTKPWGGNFGAVFSTYPKYRGRRGSIETVCERINDCFRRSLNGEALDTTSLEMKAMEAYMQWLGRGVPKSYKPPGTAISELPLMDRAADPLRGAKVFAAQCQSCHGPKGQGAFLPGTKIYRYPPLWGPHSYNSGAGMIRISLLAGFVRDNMPFGTLHQQARLSDEQAWDVAAYVNAQPRPAKTFPQDWPNISQKPIDYPFPPYSDHFSQQQHKFGPFGPIKAANTQPGLKGPAGKSS